MHWFLTAMLCLCEFMCARCISQLYPSLCSLADRKKNKNISLACWMNEMVYWLWCVFMGVSARCNCMLFGVCVCVCVYYMCTVQCGTSRIVHRHVVIFDNNHHCVFVCVCIRCGQMNEFCERTSALFNFTWHCCSSMKRQQFEKSTTDENMIFHFSAKTKRPNQNIVTAIYSHLSPFWQSYAFSVYQCIHLCRRDIRQIARRMMLVCLCSLSVLMASCDVYSRLIKSET